jgi:drug/metabolite transporter (DMT)-like permease
MPESTQSEVSRPGLLPALLLGLCAVSYGGIFSLNRIAADAGLSPIAYAFWQSAIPAAVLWVVSYLTRAPPGWRALNWLAYMLIGGGGIGIPTTLLTYVAPHLPVGLVTLVLSLSPPLTYFLGLLARLERFHWLSVVGIVCGFSGVLLIAAPTAALPLPDMAGWFLLSLVAPLLFASANIVAAVMLPKLFNSSGMAAGILLGSALTLALVMALTGRSFSFPPLLSAGTLAILASGVINGAFIVMFLEIIRMAGAVFFSQFNYLAVAAGIGWGYVLFGERLGIYIWSALGLMLVGVLLVTARERIVRLLARSPRT